LIGVVANRKVVSARKKSAVPTFAGSVKQAMEMTEYGIPFGLPHSHGLDCETKYSEATASKEMTNSTRSCRTYHTKKAGDTVAMEPLLMDRKRAVAMLSISVRGLDYLIAERRIHTRKIGGRVIGPLRSFTAYGSSGTGDTDGPRQA
jgi:hypothetical protein